MRVLSGIQPTGKMHIGNWLGAVKYWVELQEQYETLYPIVDLHALTVPQNPQKFPRVVLDKARELLAAGLNPKKCIIFIQSQVAEHSQLAWLLNTITPLGELERMTQFKEKSQKFKRSVNAGLFNYPVLMAADILLYQTDSVPVGSDQKQHLELTRELAKRFNRQYGKTFELPRALIPKVGAKMMSLAEPTKKMSKSDPDSTYLWIFEEPKNIRAKIKAAKTDLGKEIKYNPREKPGISNLLTIYSLFSEKPIKEIEKEFVNQGYEQFKESLAELLIEKLSVFRERKAEFSEQKIKQILEEGKKQAQVIARRTMQEVKQKMGLIG